MKKQRLLLALSLGCALLAGFLFGQRIARADEDAPPPPAAQLPNLFTDTALPDLFTGSFQTPIPIQVPPGRGGMAPQLALRYSSSGGNGWVGVGWELEMGAIERSGRYGVNYSGDEYLLRLAGATVEFVAIGGGDYRAKIEGAFNRIRKIGSSWEVTDKTGKRYLFGQTAASQQTGTPGIFKWCLDQVLDPNGNTMTVSYVKDQGQIYLDRIDYTGPGPTNSVKFYRESRSDVPDLYTTNFSVKTAFRLKTIDVAANGTHVRTYKLSYTTSGNTGQSLLSSVQQFGKDATVDSATGAITNEATASQLPAIGLTATNGTNGIQELSWTQGANWGNAAWSGDFNGDGKTDLATASGSSIWVKRSTGTTFVEELWSTTADWGYNAWSGDFNGDGKTDIATYSSGVIRVFRSTGSSFVEEQWALPVSVYWQISSDIQVGDFNGDGRMDVATRVGTTILVLRSTGSSFVQETWSTSASVWAPWVGDVNGDGKMDLVSASGGAIWVYRSTGSSFVKESWSTAATHISPSGFTWVGDFNGDGKTDIATSYAAGATWSFMASMDTRDGLGAGVVNGVLYAVGGYGSSGYLNTVQAYDPGTNGWTVKAPMPTARSGLGAGVADGLLYVVGGQKVGSSYLATTEAYNPATDSWTSLSPMPTPRSNLTAGGVNGILYAVGGYNATGSLTTVEAYDATTGGWATMAPMPTPRGRLAVGVVNGILYAVGGSNSTGLLNKVEAYNPTNGIWSTKAPMPTPRSDLAVGVVNGILYAVGGYGSSGYLNTVEAYNPITDSWSTITASMPTPRAELAVGVVSGILYAAGGHDNNSSFGRMESYAPAIPTGTIWVERSTGSSFEEESWTTSATNWGTSGFTWAGDFNGDGKTDIATASGGKIWVKRSTGSTFVEEVWATTASNWGTSGFTWAGDFNGDGKTDIATRSGTSIIMKRSNVFPVDLLGSISNGLGGTISISYAPSTQYANTQLPFPVQTVGSLTTDDGNGVSSTTNFTFDGGFYYFPERDFRGFSHARVSGQTGPNGERRVTDTWFHQGNDTAVNVNNPDVPVGYLQGRPYSVQISDGSNHVYALTTTSYADDVDQAAPYFTPPLEVDGYTYDGDATYKQTRTISTYETTYGNLTRMDQYGDLSDPTDDRTMVRTYSPNTTPWIIGLPSQETIYQGIQGISPSATDQVAQTTYYYDDLSDCPATPTNNQTPTKGKLTRIKRWLSGGTSPVTRMAYDATGNLRCTKDDKGNQTTISYDGSSTFPKVVTKPQTNLTNHQTTTQYYGVDGESSGNGLYGQVKSVSDLNGNLTTTQYDALGRPSRVDYPDTWTTTTYLNFGTLNATNNSQHIRTDTKAGLWSEGFFDGLGRTIMERKAGPGSNVIVTKTQYNTTGTVAKQSLPYFDGPGTPKWRTFTYDPMGRVLQATNADNTRILMCYDDGVTVSVDADNHRKRVTRDVAGHPIKVEEFKGTTTSCAVTGGAAYAKTSYQYDVIGNPRFVTDANGNQTEMRYDTLGRKVFMHDPDMGYWTSTYDGVGNLTGQIDGKGQIFTFTYDALNRLTIKSKTGQDAASPSAPSIQAATEVSESEVSLTWTTSTDDVAVVEYQIERCQGTGCSVFSRIATVAVPGYSDTGVSLGVYNYRVRAIDVASKPSAYSNTKGVTVVDITPPSAPSNLTASPVSGNQINLTWGASNDNVGVTGYQVWRCLGTGCNNFGQIATPTTSSYSDTTVLPESFYSYQVRATDARGNLGSYSNIVNTNSAWVTKAPMPTARGFLAAGVVNGLLYVVGGENANTSPTLRYLATVEAYHPTTNTWSAQAPMPTARSYLGAGVVNGLLYAMGGVNKNGVLSTVEAYDPVLNAWSAKAPMPTPRYGLAVGVVNGILYAVGGYNGSGGYLSTMEAYDPVLDAWSAKAPMPTPRGGLAVGVVNGILYALGGEVGILTNSAKVEAYNPALNNWTSMPLMSTWHYGLGAGVANGLLYAVGGKDSLFHTDTVEAYNQTSNAWTTKTPLPTGRIGLAVGVLNGILYAVGALGPLDTVEANITYATSPDVTPPSQPMNVTATAVSDTQMYLSWDASNDLVELAGYRVERCQGSTCSNFGLVARPTATSYYDSGLTFATTYRYRLRAADSAGNLSAYSTIINASTQGLPPPVISNVKASSITTTSAKITWTTNVAADSQVDYGKTPSYGSHSALVSTLVTSHSVTLSGLTASTLYHYQVKSKDGAGTLGTSGDYTFATGADLVISAVSTTATVVASGGTLPVSNTMLNQGGVAAGSSKIGFRFSPDTTAGNGDDVVAVTTRTVTSLAAGASSAATTTVTVPVLNPGAYHVCAMADSANTVAEVIETNNGLCSTTTVSVSLPDLTVSALSAPATALAGKTIAVDNTVLNQGPLAAGSSTIKFYLSTNATWDSADLLLTGSRVISSLAAGATSTATTTVTIPSTVTTGSYYLIGYADAAGTVGESDETNNTKSTLVTVPPADLVMSAVSTTATVVAPGKTLSVSSTVLNQGGLAAGSFTIGFRFSPDTIAGNGDDVVAVTTRTVTSLAVGASSTASTTVTVPALGLGQYHICVIADTANAVAEYDETNNGLCSTTSVAVDLPDMVMSVLTPNAATVNQGATLSVTNTIMNQGQVAQTGTAKITFALSVNTVYGDGDDVAIATTRSVTALAPGASNSATTSLTIAATTPPNTYYLCAMADSANGVVESDETNNTRCSAATVTVPYPDLITSAVSTTATSVIKGKTFSVSSSVINQGGSKAGAFNISFSLSDDATYGGTDDVALTPDRAVTSLAIGATSTGSKTLTVPLTAPSGTYHVCAKADSGNSVVETNENNNAACAGATITVP